MFYNDGRYGMGKAIKYRKKKCEFCGTNKRLQLHHKNLDSWDHRKSNLQTLCISCHLKLHHKLRREGKTIHASEKGREEARKRQRKLYVSSERYRVNSIKRAKEQYKENFVAMSMYQYLMKLVNGKLKNKFSRY